MICHQPSLVCHCLIRGDKGPSSHRLLRQGPGRRHGKMALMYSWLKCHAKRSSPHMAGSWMEEAYIHLRPYSLSPARDDRKVLKCRKSESLASKQLLSDLIDKAELFLEKTDDAVSRGLEFDETFFTVNHPVEEPWLVESFLISQNVAQSSIAAEFMDEESIHKDKSSASLKAKSSKKSKSKIQSRSRREASNNPVEKVSVPLENFSELDQPVEEPWLLESFIFLGSDAELVSKEETVADEASKTDSCDENPEVTEKSLPEEDINGVSKGDPVSTVILINSSVCTVQRIAVLEDGNLVELLLEPVENNVQSDSIYLGMVTKLVPHMGGAFVNIGSPRPSLMDIKNYREPFVFPPFLTSVKGKEANGSAVSLLEEQPGDDDYLNNSYNVEAVDDIDDEADDDSVGYLHDEYADQDTEDDFDIQDLPKENVNGSLPHQDEADAGGSCSIPDDKNMHDKEGFYGSQLQDVSEDHNDDAWKDQISWGQVRKGTKIIVQVVKEGLGTKGPTLTAYPKLKSRFWILSTRCSNIGISKKISGVERTRLRVIAKTLQPPGFGLTVRTVAAGHSLEELEKDLKVLLSTWKDIMEHAKSSALAADEGVEGAIPVMLHRAMGQTLSVVQDYFNEKVKSMIVDSPRTYHEITNYLEEIAPDLCERVELFNKRTPLFDEFNIEEEINNILSKRVPLDNGGYLVIEQTEALVSIDVNGGQCMLGQGTSQENAILNVNLAAAKQIARELRLRDIGGIIVVDFIDMLDDANKRLVYEEVKKSVERDRSTLKVSELSRHGLMEITRKRVRPSVTFMISEPCSCCHATGRVEALETSFSKIEHEICRQRAMMNQKPDPENPKSWPKFILQVDRHMCNYLTAGKRTRLAFLSSSLKVWLLLKVARGFTRGSFELKPLTGDKDKNSNNNYQKAAVSLLRRTEVGSYTPKRKVTVFPIKKWKTGRK